MTIFDLINSLKIKTNLNAKELYEYLGLRKSDLTNWELRKSVPSINQIHAILQLAAIYEIDTSFYYPKEYIKHILRVKYRDEYSILDYIDNEHFTTVLYRKNDGAHMIINLEDIINRKKNIFNIEKNTIKASEPFIFKKQTSHINSIYDQETPAVLPSKHIENAPIQSVQKIAKEDYFKLYNLITSTQKRVVHQNPKFGTGTIISETSSIITVHFDNGIRMKFQKGIFQRGSMKYIE